MLFFAVLVKWRSQLSVTRAALCSPRDLQWYFPPAAEGECLRWMQALFRLGSPVVVGAEICCNFKCMQSNLLLSDGGGKRCKT